MNPFLSLRNYEEFVYTLKQRFPSVQGSILNVLPDIKHHRLPASDMSFTQPNLPALIREIEELLRKKGLGEHL